VFNHLRDKLSGRVVLILFVITNSLYAVMLFYSLPAVASFAPGTPLFDLSLGGYSIKLLTTLGAAGRECYLTVQLPLDFVYPALFALTFSSLVVWAAKKYGFTWSKIFWLALLPLVAGLFDYAENVGIVLMLTRYPEVSEGLVQTASFFTVVKSACTTVYFVGLIACVIVVLARYIKRIGQRSA